MGCREVELLRVVGEHVLKAPRELGLLARERDRVAEQVPGVAGAGVGEHPLVGAVDLGELALERRLGGIGRERLRPAPVLVGIDELGLEPIDPAHEPRQQRIGTAAEVVVLQA